MNDYTIEEHCHRLAAWDAATAASASSKCRFKVEEGVILLKACEFTSDLLPDKLPESHELAEWHCKKRDKLIKTAREKGIEGANKEFTHGVAAKLINCYLKARFVCGGFHDHERVQALHPPIDRVLLKKLADNNVGSAELFWRKHEKRGWSNFESSEYEQVIAKIRTVVPSGKPLWKIEAYWTGHQH